MKLPMHWRIFIGLALGACLGLLARAFLEPQAVEWAAVRVAQPVGQIFIRLIFMAVMPLVVSALILGPAELGDGVVVLGRSSGASQQLVSYDRGNSRVAWRQQVVGNAEEAKDVVQTVFIRLWKALDKYDSSYPFSTWLYRMVMNLAIDHLRRESRHRHLDEPDDERTVVPETRGADASPAKALADLELQAVFDRLAAGLAPQQRAAFVLREVEGLSTVEVAEVLGVTASTVRNHVFQARKALKAALLLRYPEYVPRGRREPSAG